MARRRMIDPVIWMDADFHRLSCAEQVLFFCHISLADDHGRGTADAGNFKMTCFPTKVEIGEDDVEGMMKVLGARKRRRDVPMVLYYAGPDAEKYYWLPRWFRHQSVQHSKESVLPAPPKVNGVATGPPMRNPERVESIVRAARAGDSTTVMDILREIQPGRPWSRFTEQLIRRLGNPVEPETRLDTSGVVGLLQGVFGADAAKVDPPADDNKDTGGTPARGGPPFTD